MEKETPKCYSCILKLQGNPMTEVGELAGQIEVGEMRETHEPIVGKIHKWFQTGIRQPKLYQCSECKEVKIY